MNYKELICLQQTKELILTTKKGVLYEWKKIWKNLLDEKHFLGKAIHFFVKNTANNEDTWGFIQQSFSNPFSTCIGQQIQLFTLWSESRQHKF